MDNENQLKEIQQYKQHLVKLTGREIDLNTAAFIWIRKNAESWRSGHPLRRCHADA